MAEEYYIRGPEEQTARGPYNADKLRTLAEAGQVTREHFYFDPKMESWALLQSNEVLMELVFPAKKRLSLRSKAVPESTPEDSFADAPVRVEDMLAAAEGYTEETRYVREMSAWRERTAALSVPGIGVLLLISALSMIYPSWDALQTLLDDADASWALLLERPIIMLGVMDLALGLMILLNAVELFPVIRLRAMLGGGFFATIQFAAFANGEPSGLWMALLFVAFSSGLFIATLTLNFRLMIVSLAVGMVGALGLAWFNNILPLMERFSSP